MSPIVDRLRNVPLFQGMTDHALEAVADVASEVDFQDDQAITREGDAGDAFYILVDGQVKVSRNGTSVRDLGPGDFLGEISLIDGRPRTATATCVGPVKALVVQRTAFSSLIDHFGAVRHGVLMALTERIRSDEGGRPL